MGGWMGGWMEVKAVLRIAYSNQKVVYLSVYFCLAPSRLFQLSILFSIEVDIREN
jgi:hypothetical protein